MWFICAVSLGDTASFSNWYGAASLPSVALAQEKHLHHLLGGGVASLVASRSSSQPFSYYEFSLFFLLGVANSNMGLFVLATASVVGSGPWWPNTSLV